jgi:hypothetical protein
MESYHMISRLSPAAALKALMNSCMRAACSAVSRPLGSLSPPSVSWLMNQPSKPKYSAASMSLASAAS